MTQTPAGAAPVSELSYEQARDELVALVARIESGSVPLEEAMLLWERGEQLAAHCQAKLDLAQETLDRGAGASADGPAQGAGKPEDPGTEDDQEDGAADDQES